MTETPIETRIYLVQRSGEPSRLIEATSKAVAINYATRQGITAQVANQHQLVELLAAGVKVEKTSAPAGRPEEGTEGTDPLAPVF